MNEMDVLSGYLTDMARDRIICKQQLLKRYGQEADYSIKQSINKNLVKKFRYKSMRGKSIVCYHLDDYGRAYVSSYGGIPYSEVAYTVGFRTHIWHTLMVGETRYNLAKQGYDLISDYQNTVQKYITAVPGEQADLYVLEKYKPIVAIEVDRGYKRCRIKPKIEKWKETGLAIWWFTSGSEQYRKIEKYNLRIDKLCSLEELGWNPCL